MNYSRKLKLLLLVVCGFSAQLACSDSEEKSKENFQTGVVKVDIHGYRMDVPVRYMYSESMLKHKKWLTPKEGISDVDYLSLDVLLPDMQPYSEENKHKFKELGWGDKLRITVKHNKNPNWLEEVVNREYFQQTYKKATTQGDVPGLVHYVSFNRSKDVYLVLDNERQIRINCDGVDSGPSPGCVVKTNYKKELFVEYRYGLNYLQKWEDIDQKVKELIDGFSK